MSPPGSIAPHRETETHQAVLDRTLRHRSDGSGDRGGLGFGRLARLGVSRAAPARDGRFALLEADLADGAIAEMRIHPVENLRFHVLQLERRGTTAGDGEHAAFALVAREG